MKKELFVPGRTELAGNHTDHQNGRVLASAIDLGLYAVCETNGSKMIHVQSEGFKSFDVRCDHQLVRTTEFGTPKALVRGVVSAFAELGLKVGGFNAVVKSTLPVGAGLSSSAAFAVLVARVFNGLYNNNELEPKAIAQLAQQAENLHFGKPCGLMDQTASAVGNLVTIDFFDKTHPVITPVNFDFAACGHALCIIDSRASHADLTDEYAAIPGELKAVCAYFGKEVLSQIPEDAFYAAIPALRRECGDRAVLRSMHFYAENARVPQQVEALQSGDFDRFLSLIQESGNSSWMYLQNVTPAGRTDRQEVAAALGLCRHYLHGRGASRVHGGGFAGTVQAFVPFDLLDGFRAGIDAALGQGACHVLSIRPQGGVEMIPEETA